MFRSDRAVEDRKEIRSIIDDYVDFKTQLGEKDQCDEVLLARRCADSFGVGEKKCYVLRKEGDFVLPTMRSAMQTINADNPHLTERAALGILPADAAYDDEPAPGGRRSTGCPPGATAVSRLQNRLLAFDAQTVPLRPVAMDPRRWRGTSFDPSWRKRMINSLHVVEDAVWPGPPDAGNLRMPRCPWAGSTSWVRMAAWARAWNTPIRRNFQ